MAPPLLLLGNSVELTSVDTSTALDALAGFDLVGCELMAGCNIVGLDNGVNRAVLCTLTAADTLVLIDNERNELLTNACGTLLFGNVSDIFVTEELEGRENRVGSSLTETAEGVCLDVVAELFESVEIFQSAFTHGDLVEDFEKSLGTDAEGFFNSLFLKEVKLCIF